MYTSDSWSDEALHSLRKSMNKILPPDANIEKRKEELVATALSLGIVGEPITVSDLDQLAEAVGGTSLKRKLITHIEALPNMVYV